MMSKIFTALAAALAAVLMPATVATAAGTVSGRVSGTTLTITGTAGADNLTLFLSTPTTVAVDVGSDGTSDLAFDRSGFDTIAVNALGGDDVITLSNAGGVFTDTEATTVDGGDGDDQLR